MIDRVALVLLMLFALIGAVAYDRYETSQGKVSPFAHVLDYVGLAKHGSAVNSGFYRTEKREVFKANFSQLQEKLQQIENKRAELATHRKETLAQLAQADVLMKSEAASYAKIIDAERAAVLKEHPELDAEAASVEKGSLNTSSRVSQGTLSDWQNIINVLQRENKIFSDNVQAIEQQWRDGEDQAAGKVKALVEKLDAVTEKDWQELATLYKELWEQQEIFMDDAALTYQRLMTSYTQAMQQRKKVEGAIAANGTEESKTLLAAMQSLDQRMIDLLQIMETSKQEDHKNSLALLDAKNKFFHNGLTAVTASPSAPATVTPASRENPAKVHNPIGKYKIEKPPQQPSIDDQLRPWRDKARQDGFYDRMRTR